jgi:hypothetical protein
MQHPEGLAMTNNVQVLNEADLDLVSGGVRDNPWSDANNQRIAQENGAEGTFGGSISHQLVGGGPDGSLGGKPFEWP